MEDSLTPIAIVGVATLVIILFGMPIAYALGGLCLVLTVTVVGVAKLPLLGTVAYGEVANYALIVIPLFILKAEVLSEARVSDDTFAVLSRRTEFIPANLGVIACLLSTLFAAVIGSSVGNTALMTRIALRPMIARGYSPALASGIIVAGGGLGVLIPPGTLMVLYAVITEESVGRLLIGGLMPGLLISASMVAYIIVLSFFRPELVGEAKRAGPAQPARLNPERTARASGQGASIWRDLWAVMPMALIFTFVVGGMYAGLATISEIAGIGAAAALVVSIFWGRLTAESLKRGALRTVQTSAMILLIVVMASYLGRLLAFMNVGPLMTEAVESLHWSPLAVVFALNGILLLLGCILDSAAIVLIFGPLFSTMIKGLGYDPIWWGIIFVLNMEIGLIHPPFGINLLVLKGIAPDISMGTIVRGVWPFIVIQCACLLVCVLFPDLLLWLPRRMF